MAKTSRGRLPASCPPDARILWQGLPHVHGHSGVGTREQPQSVVQKVAS